MSRLTSGGVPLTRARLQSALAAAGVQRVSVIETRRHAPWVWSLGYPADTSHARMLFDDEQTAAHHVQRDADMEHAAVALAEAGYHVALHPSPHPCEIAAASPSVRAILEASPPVLTAWLAPD